MTPTSNVEDGSLSRCPECGGTYTYHAAHTEPSMFGGYVAVPGEWRCADCDHRREDDTKGGEA